ncbi:MAG: trypsin-like serine protease [Acidimicrobiales bacterium]
MRRSTTAALVVVGVTLALAGLTTVPVQDPPAAEPPPPVAAEDPVSLAAVHSSARGSFGVTVEATSGRGRPFDPGGQAAAAARLSGRTRTGAGRSFPTAVADSAESVIGPDGRSSLRGRTTTYPNSAIGRVDFRQAGRRYWCTGTLIDTDTVLTAGHCVHDGLTGADGWSTRVTFTPGAEGAVAPFGSCRSRELLTLPGWYEEGAEYQDLGLIQLDCSIGDTVGWFGFQASPGRRSLANVVVHVRGYPGDKAWSSLWTMRDRIRVSQRLMAFYGADTFVGQSGSPVFDYRPCNGDRGPCLLAVHAYGVHAGGPHADLNHGPRLDEARSALVATLAGP